MDVKHHKHHTNTILILLSVSINICALALPIYSLQAYDRIITQQNLSTFFILSIGAFALIVFEFFFRILRSNITTLHTNIKNHQSFCDVINHFLNLKSDSLDKMNLIERNETINLAYKTNDFLHKQTHTTIVDLLFLVFFSLAIAMLSLKLFFCLFLVLLAFSCSSVIVNKRLIEVEEKRSKAENERFFGIIELIQSMMVSRTHGAEQILINKHEKLERNSIFSTCLFFKRLSILTNLSNFTTQILIVITLIIGSQLIAAGQMTFGTLIACVLIVGRLTYPIKEALTLKFRLKLYSKAKKNLARFYQQEVRSNSKVKKKTDTLLAINDLTVRKNKTSSEALINGLTLKLKKGECIAITSLSGRNRTVLKNLLTGISKPEHGCIKIKGIDLDRISSLDYAKHIAYLSDECEYVRDSLYQNIKAANHLSSEQFEDACQLFDLRDEIIRIDDGFQKQVDHDNSHWMRRSLYRKINHARNYLLQPEIVILDIQDDFIDEEYYKLIFNFVNTIRNKSAILILSNDKNIVRLADSYFDINQSQYCVNDTHFLSLVKADIL